MSVRPCAFFIHKSPWPCQKGWEEGRMEVKKGVLKKQNVDNGKGRGHIICDSRVCNKGKGKGKEKDKWKVREN